MLGFRFREAFSRTGWPFLLALASGILAAIFSLARVLSWLLANHPVLIWAFFFGLVLASVLTVSRKVTRLTPAAAGWAAAGALGAYFLVGLVPASTPDTPWFLFLSGALAICAMILPGISGAFVLVLLGKYQAVLEAVNGRDFLTLALVAAGAGCGLVAFSRFLNWLLDRCHDATIAFLAGLMVGSLRKVWPWKKALLDLGEGPGRVLVNVQENALPAWDFQLLGAAVLCLAGFAAVWLLDRLAREGPAPFLRGTGQTGRRG